MIRAVVDTNVVISGLLFGGLPLRILEAAVTQRFIYVTSPVLEREARRILHDKFGLNAEDIQSLTGRLFQKAERVIPRHPIDVIKRHEPDNRVLECAVEGGCSLIVTGDRRDLLSLKRHQHVEIVTVREFLDRI